MPEGEITNSGSFLSNVGILIIAILTFIILLKIGLMIITKFFGYDGSPKLIDGMVSGSEFLVIQQDPDIGDSKTIYRSINATEGIEFTWSCWIYLDDLGYNEHKYRCIFYKGNDYSENANDLSSNGLNFPNNSPGLYITPNKNDLVVIMNTFNVINEEILIPDIPVKKWVNVMIRCQNNVIDVYVNGTIVRSHKLHGVPKQNYGNVYVGADGGFSGYISNLFYYNRALGIYEINDIVTKGPNTTMVGGGGSAMDLKNPDYLSLRWFFYGISPELTYTVTSTS
jgi:hypothetical protein